MSSAPLPEDSQLSRAQTAEAAYLNAARECIVAVGWRRTTLTDIAKRAGVSRMTIYRRWPDTATLLGDLLVREWTELFADAQMAHALSHAGEDDVPMRHTLARGITDMIRLLRSNELLVKIIDLDPELLHPYLFERLGRNQTWLVQATSHAIGLGQSDGSIRTGQPELMAKTLLLTAYGHTLSQKTAVTPEVSGASLDAELLALVERYLAP